MADDDSVDEDDNKRKQPTGSLGEGYHQTALMVYTRQRLARAAFQRKRRGRA